MKYKAFSLLFLFIFTLVLIFIFTYNLNFNIDNIGMLSKVLFYDRFIDEYIIISMLLFIFINKYRVSLLIALSIFICYVSVSITQLITFLISGEFLSRLALDNVEFIGFLITFDNILIIIGSVLVLILIPLITTHYIIKNASIEKLIMSKLFIVSLIIIGILVHYNVKFIKTDTIEKRDILLMKNHFSHTAPIQALVKLFKTKEKIKLSFTKAEVDILQDMSLFLNPVAEYPLMKNKIYDSTVKFKHTLEKPNIIIIFTEGFSARTNSIYSNIYENLTPNLKKLSENNATMLVKNFYNHTAATYRGLHGQLCSLYPLLGGGKFWLENDFLNLSKNNYKCLPHVLQTNGYETTYLNMHYKDASGNDEMVSNFGFDTILSGEELSNKYLSGINKIKQNYLSDHQSYKVLTNYLKDKENTMKKPFLLTTYTVETHAFLDIGSDGVPYADGKNNILNTIFNMDDAFGTFWGYFKNSKFAKNTIIVFTSDHAHYHGKEYINTMKQYKEKGYHQIFIDKVPLLIYAPSINLPKQFNAQQSTSIDLAPTLLHLLNVNNEINSFIGTSIFEKNRKELGISAYGENLYMIRENNLIYVQKNILPKDKNKLEIIDKFIKYTHELEMNNKLYKF